MTLFFGGAKVQKKEFKMTKTDYYRNAEIQAMQIMQE